MSVTYSIIWYDDTPLLQVYRVVCWYAFYKVSVMWAYHKHVRNTTSKQGLYFTYHIPLDNVYKVITYIAYTINLFVNTYSLQSYYSLETSLIHTSLHVHNYCLQSYWKYHESVGWIGTCACNTHANTCQNNSLSQYMYTKYNYVYSTSIMSTSTASKFSVR